MRVKHVKHIFTDSTFGDSNRSIFFFTPYNAVNAMGKERGSLCPMYIVRREILRMKCLFSSEYFTRHDPNQLPLLHILHMGSFMNEKAC